MVENSLLELGQKEDIDAPTKNPSVPTDVSFELFICSIPHGT